MALVQTPNAWITFDDADPTQLTYAVQTNPAPLTVSLPNQPSTLASMQIVISNETGGPVSVQSITFYVQVGTGASLMQTTQNVMTAVSDTANWSFPPAPAINTGTARYVLGPATGAAVTLAAGASVVVEIFQFPTILSPATTTVNVKEQITGSQPNFLNFTITTMPYGFYFDSLSATVKQGSALTPVAQVANGTPIDLVWNSSVVDLTAVVIYYSSPTMGQQQAFPGEVGHWMSPPLTSDTVFTVVVTASVSGGQAITAALSTAVAVQNPDLVAQSLAATTVNVTGAATFAGPLAANTATAGSLAVHGTLSASAASIAGNVSATGPIISTAGASSIANLTVPGTAAANALNATTANLTNASVGTANVTTAKLTNATMGNVNVTGTNYLRTATNVAFQGPTGLSNGNWMNSTDGFVIGSVWWPSDPSKGSIAWVQAASNGINAFATGGNVGSFGRAWGYCMSSNGNSFLLPVPAGIGFWCQAQQQNSSDCQQMNASTGMWWVPVGAGTLTGPSVERVGDVPQGIPPLPWAHLDRDAGRHHFIAALERVIGKQFDASAREQLLDALRQM
jgi:hypothetical protein